MALYLYGQSALDVMRYLRSTNNGEIPGRMTRTRRLAHAVNSNKGLAELHHSAQLMLSHVRGKVHVLVPAASKNTSTPRLVTHLHSGELPSGAYLDLGNGIYLPTPQYLMMQLASEIDEISLAMVGLELCGFFSRWKQPPYRPSVTVEDEFSDCTFELHQALTAAQLSLFTARLEGERGVKKLRWALEYIRDCAASPMEVGIYLLLCLPRRLGGYGFPKPDFNVEVTVTTSTTTDKRYPDLYWADPQVDVEYQSDYAHSGDYFRYRDSRRAVELVAEKIIVLPLTRAQATNAEEFAAFAESLRRNIGQPKRPLSAEWAARHAELRERLLRDNPGARR